MMHTSMTRCHIIIMPKTQSPQARPSKQRIFELQAIQPEAYRAQTRKTSMIIIAIFAVSAMLLSSVLVVSFGESGGNNFKWNLSGVLLGVLLTSVLVGNWFNKQPWMAASVYGWRLKRSLMSVTNCMHQVKAGVADSNPTAMQVLRFYHLALLHMHQLDGNSSDASSIVKEMDEHKERMEALQLSTDQQQLHPDWLLQLKATYKSTS